MLKTLQEQRADKTEQLPEPALLQVQEVQLVKARLKLMAKRRKLNTSVAPALELEQTVLAVVQEQAPALEADLVTRSNR